MPPTPFHVSESGEVRAQFLAVMAQAAAEGRRAAVLTSARVILNAMTWMADEIGESRGDYGTLGERRAFTVGDLTVFFVVNVTYKLVWIQRYQLRRP